MQHFNVQPGKNWYILKAKSKIIKTKRKNSVILLKTSDMGSCLHLMGGNYAICKYEKSR